MCIFVVVAGCVDSNACNYVETATDDDGSCTYAGDHNCTGSDSIEWEIPQGHGLMSAPSRKLFSEGTLLLMCDRLVIY